MKSIKSECLDHVILSSVEQLEYVLHQYGDYYHHERIHQSLGRIIEPNTCLTRPLKLFASNVWADF